jgi:hypothetical protein
MKQLRKLFFRIFKCYREDDVRLMNYSEADKLMRDDSSWKLSWKEDCNPLTGFVWICKKTRITE